MKLQTINLILLEIIIISLICKNVLALSFREAITQAKNQSKELEIENTRLQILKQEKNFRYTEFLPNIKASYDYSQRNSYFKDQQYDRSNKQVVKEIRVEQPIFDGFASLIKIKQDQHLFNAKKSNVENKTNQVLLILVKTYCELFKYQQINKILDYNQQLFKEAEKLFEQQKSLKYIDNSIFIANKIESEIFWQKFNENKFKLKKAKRDYQEYFNTQNEDLLPPEIDIDTDTISNNNKDKILQNPLVKSSFNNYQASIDEYHLKKTSYSPKISVSGVISKQENVVYLNNQDLSSRGIYLNLTIPIFQSGGEYLNLINARNKIKLASDELQQIKNDLLNELDQAIFDYENLLNQKKYCENINELSKNKLGYFRQKYSLNLIDRLTFLKNEVDNNNLLINCIEINNSSVVAYYKIKSINGEINEIF